MSPQSEEGLHRSKKRFLIERPFGEQVAADGTYRTTNLVYNAGDNIRQKFTGYQKDDETGLGFAEARLAMLDISEAYGKDRS